MSLSTFIKKPEQSNSQAAKDLIDEDYIHEITTREFRGSLSEVMENFSQSPHDIALITSHGKPKMACISIDEFLKLVEKNTKQTKVKNDEST